MARKDAITLLHELKRDHAAMGAAIALIEGKIKPGTSPTKGRHMSAETKAKLSKIMKARRAAEKKAKG